MSGFWVQGVRFRSIACNIGSWKRNPWFLLGFWIRFLHCKISGVSGTHHYLHYGGDHVRPDRFCYFTITPIHLQLRTLNASYIYAYYTIILRRSRLDTFGEVFVQPEPANLQADKPALTKPCSQATEMHCPVAQRRLPNERLWGRACFKPLRVRSVSVPN